MNRHVLFFAAAMPAVALALLRSGAAIAFDGVPSACAAPSTVPTTRPDAERWFHGLLQRGNEYRAMEHLPQVAEDPSGSDAAALHARYLVKNKITKADLFLADGRIRSGPPEKEAHDEISSSPWYTAKGVSAAAPFAHAIIAGDILGYDGRQTADCVMTLPFSSLSILDPQLTGIGFGSYCEAEQCAALLSLRFGLDKATRRNFFEAGEGDLLWNPNLGVMPWTLGKLRAPIAFPPEGSTVTQQTYLGGDWPDPLAGCPQYSPPMGLPISFQMGGLSRHTSGLEVMGHSLTHNGVELPHCFVDAKSYTANDTEGDVAKPPSDKGRRFERRMARVVLNASGMVILIPREPLRPGTYTVSITANSKKYEWSFTVVAAEATATANGSGIK